METDTNKQNAMIDKLKEYVPIIVCALYLTAIVYLFSLCKK